ELGESSPHGLSFGVELGQVPYLYLASELGSFPFGLPIFGLKTLVRSFLPHQSATVSRPIDFLLDIILEMLHKGSHYDGIISSDSDKAHIRLAAAKSVLQLSRRWDSIISPQIFRCTVLTAKDSSPLVQRLFIKKVQKLLKEHKIPCRYACAFPFAATDPSEDLQQISLKYMEEFVHIYGNAARINRMSTMPGHVTGFPVYIVVFLIHVLAHDPNFPTADHHDANSCAQFFSPLVFSLRALVDLNFSDGTVDLINKAFSYLRSIFHAIKKAEDAIDAQITPNLHMLSDIGISLLDALSNKGVSHSHISGLILLPSSLYKVGQEHYSQASSFHLIGGKIDLLIRYKLDENFIGKLLDISKKKLQTAGTITTQYQKCHGGMVRSGNSRGSKLEMQFCKKGPLPLSMVKKNSGSYSDKEEISPANQELTTRERQKTSEPCSASASFELHKEFSIDDEHDDDSHGTIERVVRTEQQPYCSRTLRSRSLSDQKISKCKTIMREPSKSMKGNNSDICISKGSKNIGEKLLRQHKEPCTPQDKCCSGTTEVFDSSNNSLKVGQKIARYKIRAK
ncbi:putative sister chromatid cohesion protein PDS5 -like protein A-like isoform X2, partial [Capsicum annuum]